jgi:hypothetical protein
MRSTSVTRSLLAAVAVASVTGAGCSKLVGVELAVAEPCGQELQALNGVQSYRVVSSGSSQDGVVAFTATQPAGVAIGLGEQVIVSVEAYADNITASETPEQPTVAPTAVGRSMPLTIDEGTLDVTARVLVGRVDSFGGPRDLEDNCTAMDSGEAGVTGRHAHTATFVPGVNKVLIFGGAAWSNGQESLLKSAEVYDPATGTFTALPAPAQARAYHTATALPDGRVVILGGFSVVNGQVAPIINGLIVDLREDNPYVGDIILRTPRAHHTATLLADVGLIAIIGGCTGSGNQGCTPGGATLGSTNLTPTVEVLDTASMQSTPAQGSLNIPRAMHQAVGFPSGNTGIIVVAGGLNDSGALRSVEFFQVSSGSLANVFAAADALPEAAVRHHMIAFNNDQFVITGGQASAPNGILSDAAPGSAATTICSKVDGRATCVAGATMLGARFGHHSARLLDGTIVVMGGAVAAGGPTSEALRFQAGGAPPAWTATARALPVARERAAVTLLGGELGNGFTNQIFYSGGHTTLQPYATVDTVDLYFGK